MESATKRKIQAIRVVESKLKPGFEQDFMKNMYEAVKGDWSVERSEKRMKTINDIYKKYVTGESDSRSENDTHLQYGNVTAKKGDDGWQLSIDGRMLGASITGKCDAEVICEWMERSWETLCIAIDPPASEDADSFEPSEFEDNNVEEEGEFS